MLLSMTSNVLLPTGLDHGWSKPDLPFRSPFRRVFLKPMLRVSATLAVLLGLVASAHADEAIITPSTKEPTVTPGAIEEAAIAAQFDSLVAKGDQERAKGLLAEAATAYALALRVRREPLIAGRLGVLLVQLGKTEQAPELLLDAIHRANDASTEERHAFLRAYDKAQTEGAWVEIVISHAGTTMTLDGRPKNKEGWSSVFMFVLAGDHELRATLKGYDDAFARFSVAKGGKSMRVELTLRPLPDPVGETAELLRKRSSPRIENPELPPDDETPIRREPVQGGVEGAPRPDKPRISVSAGPVLVFGVASWQPAVGAVAEIRWRPKDYFSLGAEGRAAWLTSGVAGEPISAMTAGGIASACGHWRWIYGCALGHLGVVNIEFSGANYSGKAFSFAKPGGGVRIGATVRLGSSFVVQGAFDAVALARGTSLRVGQTIVVEQAPYMFGSQVLGGWEF